MKTFDNLTVEQKFILDNYKAKYICQFGLPTHKTRIKQKGKCRYCKKEYPEVTFKTASHSFPQFIGNKFVISNDECDSCNKYFSETLEKDFAIFMKVFHNIHGKEDEIRIPNYNYEGIRLERDKNEFKLCGVERNLFSSNGGTVIINTEKHKPINVHKCLVKMALTMVADEDLPVFENTFKWLLSKDNENFLLNGILPVYVTITQNGESFEKLTMLFEKKSDIKGPVYIFKIFYSTFSFQIFIPFTTSELGKPVDLSHFIEIPNNYALQSSGSTKTFLLDLNCNETISYPIEISIKGKMI